MYRRHTKCKIINSDTENSYACMLLKEISKETTI